MVNLIKSYNNIHGTTYRIKILLSCIAIINTGYFDNINMVTTCNKIKRHRQDINIGVYHFVSRTMGVINLPTHGNIDAENDGACCHVSLEGWVGRGQQWLTYMHVCNVL